MINIFYVYVKRSSTSGTIPRDAQRDKIFFLAWVLICLQLKEKRIGELESSLTIIYAQAKKFLKFFEK